MIIAIVIAVALIIMAFCKVSGICARKEEQEDCCDGCLRWPECNGVDEDCPWRG